MEQPKGGAGLDLFDLWQNMRIDRVSHAADDAAGPARAASGKQAFTEKEVARLALITQAMWTLVKERTGLTDDDLMAAMAELDLADGRADGRKRPAGPIDCPKCGRTNSRNRDFCIYCGEMVRTRPFQ